MPDANAKEREGECGLWGLVLWGRLWARALEDLGQAWEEKAPHPNSRLIWGPQNPTMRCVCRTPHSHPLKLPGSAGPDHPFPFFLKLPAVQNEEKESRRPL